MSATRSTRRRPGCRTGNHAGFLGPHQIEVADIVQGRINPGRVFDYETNLEGGAEAYAAMDERRAIKSLLRVGTKEGSR